MYKLTILTDRSETVSAKIMFFNSGSAIDSYLSQKDLPTYGAEVSRLHDGEDKISKISYVTESADGRTKISLTNVDFSGTSKGEDSSVYPIDVVDESTKGMIQELSDEGIIALVSEVDGCRFKEAPPRVFLENLLAHYVLTEDVAEELILFELGSH